MLESECLLEDATKESNTSIKHRSFFVKLSQLFDQAKGDENEKGTKKLTFSVTKSLDDGHLLQ